MQYEKPSVAPLFSSDDVTEPDAISVVVVVVAAVGWVAAVANVAAAVQIAYAATEVETWSPAQIM